MTTRILHLFALLLLVALAVFDRTVRAQPATTRPATTQSPITRPNVLVMIANARVSGNEHLPARKPNPATGCDIRHRHRDVAAEPHFARDTPRTNPSYRWRRHHGKGTIVPHSTCQESQVLYDASVDDNRHSLAAIDDKCFIDNYLRPSTQAD